MNKNIFFSSKGRLSAKNYFVYSTFLTAILTGIITVSSTEDPMSFLGAPFILVFLISAILVSIKRMHDLGLSGWHLLFSAFSGIGIFIVHNMLTFSSGEKSKNEFGNKDTNSFKRKWFEKAASWLIETLNGRILIVVLSTLVAIELDRLYPTQSMFPKFETILGLTDVVFMTIIAFRLETIEKNKKKIIQACSVLGGFVLSAGSLVLLISTVGKLI